MTALTAIFGAVDERLAGLVGADGCYERMPSGDPDGYPALHVYDDGDEPEEARETDTERLELIITVEGFVKGASGAEAHDAMLALHASVVAALCSDAENLGGVVQDIGIVGRRRVDVATHGEVRSLGFAQDFRVEYATRRGDPSIIP